MNRTLLLVAVAIAVPVALLNVFVLSCDGRTMSREYLAQIDATMLVFVIAMVATAFGISL